MHVTIDRLVKAWVLDRIPREFKIGASIGALTRRYGLTREAVEAVIRRFMCQSRRRV